MDLIKCKWCGEDTPYLATKECDRCHRANSVMRERPDLVAAIDEFRKTKERIKDATPR